MARASVKQSTTSSSGGEEKYDINGSSITSSSTTSDDVHSNGDELWQQLFIACPSLLDRVMVHLQSLLAKRASEWIVHGLLRVLQCTAIRHLLPLSRHHITPLYDAIQQQPTIASVMLLARLRSEYIFVFGEESL